jgi:AcrR family transcriptional regulator
LKPLQKDRKHTQRERLLAGMLDAVAEGGYAEASIAQVIAHAGVSRPTFYDYFTDKDDCFLAVVSDAQRQLLAHVAEALEGVAPEHATAATIQALIAFASTQPTLARLTMSEPMAAGSAALDARDHGVEEIARLLERSLREAPGAAAAPDLCGPVLVGGLYRLLARRLGRGEPGVNGLSEDLLSWVAAYEQPVGEHRWRELRAAAIDPPSPRSALLLAPPPLPPGRPSLSQEEVLHTHRQRILLATAEVAMDKGLQATTVADITKHAGVSSRAFYRLFLEKQEALAAVHELFFQHLMAITATAFFTGASWPERIWTAVQAFTDVLERNPTLAYIEFVESHAAGAQAMQRFNDAIVAFTIFLQEGYQAESVANPPPPLALEAVIATSFEVFYRQIRRRGEARVRGFLPHFVYLSLAPFLGPAASNEFIAGKLRALAPPRQSQK